MLRYGDYFIFKRFYIRKIKLSTNVIELIIKPVAKRYNLIFQSLKIDFNIKKELPDFSDNSFSTFLTGSSKALQPYSKPYEQYLLV